MTSRVDLQRTLDITREALAAARAENERLTAEMALVRSSLRKVSDDVMAHTRAAEDVTKLRVELATARSERDEARGQIAELKERLHISEMELARMRGYIDRVRDQDDLEHEPVQVGESSSFVARMSDHSICRQIEREMDDKIKLLRQSLSVFVDSYARDADWVGDSDLDNEQPRSIHVTLGTSASAVIVKSRRLA
jgi:chromosome segregation ATPase